MVVEAEHSSFLKFYDAFHDRSPLLPTIGTISLRTQTNYNKKDTAIWIRARNKQLLSNMNGRRKRKWQINKNKQTQKSKNQPQWNQSSILSSHSGTLTLSTRKKKEIFTRYFKYLNEGLWPPFGTTSIVLPRLVERKEKREDQSVPVIR